MDTVFSWVPFHWQVVGTLGVLFMLSQMNYQQVRIVGRKSGEYLSMYMSKIPGWEGYCEPMICQQLSRAFIFTNALLDGMGTDNVPENSIDNILLSCRQDISKILDDERVQTVKRNTISTQNLN